MRHNIFFLNFVEYNFVFGFPNRVLLSTFAFKWLNIMFCLFGVTQSRQFRMFVYLSFEMMWNVSAELNYSTHLSLHSQTKAMPLEWQIMNESSDCITYMRRHVLDQFIW